MPDTGCPMDTSPKAPDATDPTGQNLQRLMAERGLTIEQVVAQTGVDRRTVRAVLHGISRPHARTLHRLAAGLEVPVDEFFLDDAHLRYRRFDRRTNPVVEEVLQSHRDLFAGWSEADFDELHSRVGHGGGLTHEGTLAAARQMNRKRQLHEQLDVLLESSHAELIAGMIELAYRQMVVEPEG